MSGWFTLVAVLIKSLQSKSSTKRLELNRDFVLGINRLFWSYNHSPKQKTLERFWAEKRSPIIHLNSSRSKQMVTFVFQSFLPCINRMWERCLRDIYPMRFGFISYSSKGTKRFVFKYNQTYFMSLIVIRGNAKRKRIRVLIDIWLRARMVRSCSVHLTKLLCHFILVQSCLGSVFCVISADDGVL